MTILCVLIVLKGHIQLLDKILQPAKYIDNEGNVAWKLAIGQVCPLYKQKVRTIMMVKVRHHGCQLYACAKRSTINRHGRIFLQEIEMRSDPKIRN